MSVLSTKLLPAKSELLASFTNGVKPDQQLYKEEIAVQLAWAKGLQNIGMLSQKEFADIEQALIKAASLMETGTFDWREEDEDIHMNLERFVNDATNGLGKKMHAGRSRNDLIATTLKLNVANNCISISSYIEALIQALVNLAERNIDVIVPGMTHLQNGQPVRFAHALLAHAWGFKRDIRKFQSVKQSALTTMPLGAAALAGTTIAIDLVKIADELGFSSPSSNSYDSVSERDSVIDFMQASAHFGTHLSRLAEDIIYWASAPVGLIKLSPDWSTGSSIMPNKRNPDVAELARAKAGLWIGSATGILSVVKALPTSYASDLHETKVPYLQTFHEMKLTLQVFTEFVSELAVNKDVAKGMLNRGHILATEIANHMNEKGVPFREAYKSVAALVEMAESKQKQVHELSWEEMKKVTEAIDKSFLNGLTFESTVEKRAFAGGTSLKGIKEQIKALRS